MEQNNMAVLEILASFRVFLQQQNICDESEWSAFESRVQGNLTVGQTERLDEDVTKLIKTLQGIQSKIREVLVDGDGHSVVLPSGRNESKDHRQDGAQSGQDSHAGMNPLSQTTNKKEEEPSTKLASEEPSQDKSHTHYTDSNLVQIRASKAEIDRRIAAFMERKRLEVDESNQREFCTLLSMEPDGDSCARTEAVFLPRPDNKSHVKVTRVVNQYGPQTRQHLSPTRASHSGGNQEKSKSHEIPGALEERLSNMEKHTNIKYAPQDQKSIYERLKALENRILHLESISPEYFTQSAGAKRRCVTNSDVGPSVSAADEAMDLTEINARITSLRKTLGLRS